MRIGIPRTLWFYSYAPFWQRFFTELGARVVVSPPTTRSILDEGVAACVSEACLPIKVLFGHLDALAGRVDYIFLPRLVCLHSDRLYCPKFLGLPDLVRHSGMTLPPTLEVRLDRRTGPLFLLKACLQLAEQLGMSRWRALRAYTRSLVAHRQYRRHLLQGGLPAGARPTPTPDRAPPAGGPLSVAVVGYPYLIFDDYVNLGLLAKLAARGVTYRTAETVPDWLLRRQNRAFAKRPFWHYSDVAARAGYHFLAPGAHQADGVIHITAFACGPDAVVDKMLELEAERRGSAYLNITLDEQSGEAGYITRLEAFLDMLERKGAAARA
ncbi:MAG TPA: acyl-CoA dehydratase activase-related protein [Symbiobacteriaceae bacterium]|nr:acyl-CoA dehydratase activase-related protein [Symbiobacteriaceae bacterium]